MPRLSHRRYRKNFAVRRQVTSKRVLTGNKGKVYVNKPVVYRLPVGLPETYMCKLRYNGIVTLNPPAGNVPAIQAYRLNSLFDFDLTGVGHQPTPFDQMASFYKKYFVRGVKVIISPMRKQSDSMANGFQYYGAIIQPASGITAGFSWDDIMQGEKATQRIHVFATTGADSSPDKMTGPVKIYYSAKKYYGKGYDDEDYKSLVTTSPAKGPTLDVWAINPFGDDASAINLNVWAEFITTFSDPQTLGIS